MRSPSRPADDRHAHLQLGCSASRPADDRLAHPQLGCSPSRPADDRLAHPQLGCSPSRPADDLHAHLQLSRLQVARAPPKPKQNEPAGLRYNRVEAANSESRGELRLPCAPAGLRPGDGGAPPKRKNEHAGRRWLRPENQSPTKPQFRLLTARQADLRKLFSRFRSSRLTQRSEPPRSSLAFLFCGTSRRRPKPVRSLSGHRQLRFRSSAGRRLAVLSLSSDAPRSSLSFLGVRSLSFFILAKGYQGRVAVRVGRLSFGL
jgi:hypothetical protein